MATCKKQKRRDRNDPPFLLISYRKKKKKIKTSCTLISESLGAATAALRA